MAKSFSAILLEYKEKHSLTQEQMAAKIGLSLKMYQLYEKGKYKGTEKKIKTYLGKLTSNNVDNHNKDSPARTQELERIITELRQDKEDLRKRILDLEKQLEEKKQVVDSLQQQLNKRVKSTSRH